MNSTQKIACTKSENKIPNGLYRFVNIIIYYNEVAAIVTIAFF